MKIILVDEEAHQYMDMREDLAEYKERIAELNTAIDTLTKKYHDVNTECNSMVFELIELRKKCGDKEVFIEWICPPDDHNEAYNTAMEVIRTHDYPTDTTREENTSVRWSDRDKAMLTDRIFMTGKYYGSDRTFDMIRALFPERTEASVKAMIYTLGGICKKGIVHPRIQPKHKGE
jgi:hypothetical protein